MASVASSSSSSSSPSSSAVIIPTPGRSILKRPPAQNPSLLSRITRFLPTQPSPSATSGDEAKTLKRAHFILPEIATVYPISSLNPPSTPTLKDEKRAVEERERDRRRRVLKGDTEQEEWWTMDKVESFYRECCQGCEERPDPGVSVAFKRASSTDPRMVDFSGVQLTFTSASILSDVFAIEWGLRKLVFKECDLDEHNLKPILHALLIPNTLTYLSVSLNRQLKPPAFRLLGAFAAKAEHLQFLDLSQNSLDKKCIEYIVAALKTPPETGLLSLKLDDCSLRPAALEALSRVVRTSSLRNISLRYNRINATGAVALALMIKDYPDAASAPLPTSSPTSSAPSSPASSSLNLPISPTISTAPHSPVIGSAPPTPRQHTLPSHPPQSNGPADGKLGPLLPPPHRTGPVAPQLQTTYTPYVPRSRRNVAVSQLPSRSSTTSAARSPSLPPQQVPIITSSAQGGVTTRTTHQGPSAALLDKVRALDALPRLGALRTLDLKGNDLRAQGISYLSQVLKRNRTLKVLNLSENKLDVPCLVNIAEALKYNSTLETLDLSRNACAGPGLEGIQSLRTAFTLNSALKRLFLSQTNMTSAGAIALAEFLPESTSLLHLDLTLNNLDLAGVMALSSGLKANTVMRCLDVNIPPGDEEFARMCRDILDSCVRNTEAAQAGSGLGKGVWGMIEESELAKTIKLDDEVDRQNNLHIMVRSRACLAKLKDASVTPPPFEDAQALITELGDLILNMDDPGKLEELLGVNDELRAAVEARKKPARKLNLRENGHPLVEGEGVETPRIDKGKGRAEVEHEKVLSPTSAMLANGDDEDGEGDGSPLESSELGLGLGIPHAEGLEGASPTNRSKSWVEEEGEVFRKGTVLLGPEEMEGEYAGEDLRKELLEAMVERAPPRPIDEFGMDLSGVGPVIDGNGSQPNTPRDDGEDQLNTPTSPEPKKEPPRPYLRRSRSSSSSLMSLVSSPTQGAPSTPTVQEEQTTQNSAEDAVSPSSPNGSLGPRSYVTRQRST